MPDSAVLRGLIAAPFTPFDADGKIRFELIASMAGRLIADGVTGAYVCGTTGEGISCSTAERMELMRAWRDAAAGKLVLIAHTGAAALPDVETLNRCAVDLGYDAVSVIPPTFFRPSDESALAEYCRAAAASAPELPFYYYHTMNARLELSMERFLAAAAERIPTLAGIKFNHHNLYEYQRCREFDGGRFQMVFGVDEFFAAALELGATCFIGSTYNYSARLYHAVWNAWKCGDHETVRQNMKRICDGVALLNQYGGIPAGKAMMRLRGVDCGPARLPLRRLSGSEQAVIAERMGQILAGVPENSRLM